MDNKAKRGILIMVGWLLFLSLLLLLASGCQLVTILPKVIQVRYLTVEGKRLLVICTYETRADTPHVTYECDVGEQR
jgi:hypothetical protein